MISHFPPASADIHDKSFLTVGDTIFAKFKTETKTTTKRVFLTEDTLIFVLKGRKHLHIGTETVLLGPREIMFLKKGIYAMAEYFEEGLKFEAILLFLHPKTVREVVSEYNLAIGNTNDVTPFLKLPVNSVIENYRQMLQQYFTDNALKDRGILLLKQKEILLYILKTVPFSKTAPFWNSVMSNSAEQVSYIVEKYIFERLSIGDYAKLANKSLSSFKRDFMSIYKCPPKKWIIQKRLEHAHLLLNNTEERVSTISDQCGFDDLSYFSKIFKRQYGQTPSELRTNCHSK